MKKPVICFFNSSKTWGGGEKWHFDTAMEFREFSEPVIISNPESELLLRAKAAGIKTISLKVSNLSFVNPFRRTQVKKIFDETKPDTVVLNLPSDLKLAAPVAKKCGVPKVIYRRGSAIPIKSNSLNKKIFANFVDLVIANSQETKRTILNVGDVISPEKIKIVYNWIDTEFIKPEKSQNEIFTIGNAGRLCKQKNQTVLIDLAKKLKSSGFKFIIKIAGEGPLKNELYSKISSEGLENEVQLLGFAGNMSEFYNSLDLFILTSTWEGFGYVIAESMLAEKAVIAFDISSNPELTIDNLNGYLVPYNNIGLLAEKVIILANNRDRLNTFGKNGRKFVIDNFSKDKIIPILKSLLLP